MTTIDETAATFSGSDGTAIFYRHFALPGERLRIVVSHGLGEHSGRYGNLVESLCPLGASLWIPDHRGHGRSQGRRGHVSDFGDYARDLKILIDRLRSDGMPLLLIGHSMGGLIALSLARRFPESIDGLAVSSPLLGLPKPVPPAMRVLSHTLAVLWPTLSLTNGLDATYISHDRDIVDTYGADKLVHNRISARWTSQCMREISAVHSAPDAVEVPFLMQIAGDDRLVSPAASLAYFDSLTTTDKTLCHYEDLYHEIYNERQPDRQRVLEDLTGWVAKRFFDLS